MLETAARGDAERNRAPDHSPQGALQGRNERRLLCHIRHILANGRFYGGCYSLHAQASSHNDHTGAYLLLKRGRLQALRNIRSLLFHRLVKDSDILFLTARDLNIAGTSDKLVHLDDDVQMIILVRIACRAYTLRGG